MASTAITALPSELMGGYDYVLTPFAPGGDVALNVLGNRTECTNPSCTNEGTKKCGRCNTVRYCSRECQVEHWKSGHKSLCQRPTAASTFIGKEVPASWLAVNSGGGGSSPGSVSDARVIHDDSRRGKAVEKPAILSQASRASLVSYLEFHSPNTDGSFTICISGGSGAFISEKLYSSIPVAYRPEINLRDAGKKVDILYQKSTKTLGSIMMPVILKTSDSGEWIKLILYTFVLKNELTIPMFISWEALVDLKPQWGVLGVTEEDKKMVIHFENERGVFNIKGL